MAGRPMWGWLKHKHEEFRRPTTIVDTDGKDVDVSGSDNIELDSETYSRMWGGLHFIYSFGDSHQLPPVGMKPMYSSEVASPETSDSAGRVAWSEFFNPPENDETENTVVVMEDVIRQDSTQQNFKDALAHMREGNMEKRDVELLIQTS